MLDTVRRSLAIPRLRIDVALAAATTVSFGWLLANDFLQPLAVYLLQLYLAF